jgi:hypothetical protein
MPVSQRKRRANQLNAAKSTGPITDEGKRRTRHNAIRHGMFSVDVVLPGEDHAAYIELRRDCIDSLRPQDALQLSVVERIASATWRLRRLHEAHRWLHEGRLNVVREEMLEHRPDPAASAATERQLARMPAAVVTALLLQDENNALERLGRYEQRLELSIQRSLRQLRELQNPKIQRPQSSPFSADCSDPATEQRWAIDPSLVQPPDPICENEPTAAPTSRNIEFTSPSAAAVTHERAAPSPPPPR